MAVDRPVTLVITLRNGVQLKARVDEYTFRHAGGKIHEFTWVTAGNRPRLKFVDLDEMVAIQEDV